MLPTFFLSHKSKNFLLLFQIILGELHKKKNSVSTFRSQQHHNICFQHCNISFCLSCGHSATLIVNSPLCHISLHILKLLHHDLVIKNFVAQRYLAKTPICVTDQDAFYLDKETDMPLAKGDQDKTRLYYLRQFATLITLLKQFLKIWSIIPQQIWLRYYSISIESIYVLNLQISSRYLIKMYAFEQPIPNN